MAQINTSTRQIKPDFQLTEISWHR